MAAVVFSTPTELDLRAITTFGMNVKPNTISPIGYFGTGLKYAIAVLVREGIPVTIVVGEHEFNFYAKDKEFRGKSFSFVMMKKRWLFSKWFYTELPFTTELGKNWELWQAYRELESNTRDENGETSIWNADPPGTTLRQLLTVHYGKNLLWTHIIVGGVNETRFDDIQRTQDLIFLPMAATAHDVGSPKVQVFDRPCDHVYYRGMRIQDLKKPTRLTYNILTKMDLTEDRTLKYSWQMDDVICRFIACETKDEKLIHTVVSSDPEKFYEASLNWEGTYTAPSAEFMRVVDKKNARKNSAPTVLPRVSSYVQRYTPAPRIPDNQKLWYKLQEWVDSGEIAGYPDLETVAQQCVDAMRREGLDDIYKENYVSDRPAVVEVVWVPRYSKSLPDDDVPF